MMSFKSEIAMFTEDNIWGKSISGLQYITLACKDNVTKKN
jgi:hypothetical protein